MQKSWIRPSSRSCNFNPPFEEGGSDLAKWIPGTSSTNAKVDQTMQFTVAIFGFARNGREFCLCFCATAVIIKWYQSWIKHWCKHAVTRSWSVVVIDYESQSICLNQVLPQWKYAGINTQCAVKLFTCAQCIILCMNISLLPEAVIYLLNFFWRP